MSNYGFKQTGVKNYTADGHNFTLLEDLIYQRMDGQIIRARAGSTTDGMSIPEVVKALVPAAMKLCETGFLSGVLHDGGYRGTLDLQTPAANWIPIPLATCDESYCDALIKEALTSQGIEPLEVMAVFLALKECGWRAFDEDRKVVTA